MNRTNNAAAKGGAGIPKAMKQESKVRRNLILTFATIALVAAVITQAAAQTSDPQNPNVLQQGQMQNPQTQMPNLSELNLTPDQIQKIRAINADLRDQRQTANQRLRQAQRALAEAMESPNQNEALIDQRSRDVADAQAANIRLRALSEYRILQVLSPEQRVKLREMRVRNQALRQERRLENNQRPRVLRRDGFQRGGKPGAKTGPPANTQQKSRPN